MRCDSNHSILKPGWGELPHVEAGFTTRLFSPLGLPHEARRVLADYLHLPQSAVISMTQVHGNHVIDMNRVFSEEDIHAFKGDALVTNRPNIALVVRTADCVPILLVDRKKEAIAAIHAGWKGLQCGVIQSTVNTLIAQYGSQPEDIVAAIGPCIGPCCFEVGSDVLAQFEAIFPAQLTVKPAHGDHVFLDLIEIAKLSLNTVGISEIHRATFDDQDETPVKNLCTVCAPELFYSYRREPESSSRLFSFIVLRK